MTKQDVAEEHAMGQLSQSAMTRLREENQELRRAVEELSILNDLAGVIGGTTDVDQILDMVVRRSVQALEAGQGAIFLVDSQEEISTSNTLIRAIPEPSSDPNYHMSQQLLGWMELYMKPLLVNDPDHDDRFRSIPEADRPASILAVPLIARSRLIATLVLFNRKGDGFTPDDQRLLSIIASQSAQVLENARLNHQERLLQTIQHEMELAATIQERLLPSVPPLVPGYDIAGRTRQRSFVGGDFFDFIPCPASQVMISLGDVCGKGLPASLLMSNVNAILRTEILHDHSPPSILSTANTILHQSTTTDKFVTLLALLLDRTTNSIRYANAGHTLPVIVRRDGSIGRLEGRGIMLGLTDTFQFSEGRLELDEGDMVALFSDGITEGIDCDRNEFGEERLLQLLTDLRHRPASDIIDEIFRSVQDYCENEESLDDMTLVIIRRV